MVEIFVYSLEWVVVVHAGLREEKYAQISLTIADPVKAMPVILKAVERKWGKPERVIRFTGPNGSNNFYVEGASADA